jgi:hypothetical protein
VINQNAEQDLNMQLKNQQNKAEKFFPAAGTQGESQSQEDNVMQSEDLQADSDYLGDGAASNQFLQEQEQDAEYDDGANEQLDMQEENADEDEDVIDIDNPEELAQRGYRRIRLMNEETNETNEYLLNNEGQLYDLQGDFCGNYPQLLGEEGEN